MTIEEYQKEVMRTCGATIEGDRLVMSALGLAGETGEVVDIIKKYIFHSHNLPAVKLRDELGDVLWYLTVLGEACGLDLENIMEHNIKKLRDRYPSGFDSQRSINRAPGEDPPRCRSCASGL